MTFKNAGEPVRNVRTQEQLREHYLIERELADKLRAASREERRTLYRSVYDELFKRVPLHPGLTRKASPEATQVAVSNQLRFLRRFLRRDHTFLEVGPGDCALSFAVAKMVQKVYAVDVSSAIAENPSTPANFELIISDGSSINVLPNSIDLAYSNQLLEHLHPDDALEQLQNVHRALKPGGKYVCITPNRLDGPHDISRYFTETATGFHLREYTIGEGSDLFRRAGFARVSAFFGVKGRFIRLPVRFFGSFETLLGTLPSSFRRLVASNLPFRLLLPVRLVATK